MGIWFGTMLSTHLHCWPCSAAEDGAARTHVGADHITHQRDRCRVYTRGEYWDERVKMMQHWSDYLDQLRDGAKILRPNFGTGRNNGS